MSADRLRDYELLLFAVDAFQRIYAQLLAASQALSLRHYAQTVDCIEVCMYCMCACTCVVCVRSVHDCMYVSICVHNVTTLYDVSI